MGIGIGTGEVQRDRGREVRGLFEPAVRVLDRRRQGRASDISKTLDQNQSGGSAALTKPPSWNK